MSTITSGRFAAATSIVALVVAMGGTGYAAAGKITGHDIKKNAINSSKVKNDSLTGKDVKESSLGQVPSAATAGHAGSADSATTATNAGNAGAVSGVKITKVNFQVNGAGGAVVFSGNGLTITAGCSAAGDISLDATTSKANSSIYTFADDDSTPEDPMEDDYEDNGFDPGDTESLLAGQDGDIAGIQFGYSNPDGSDVTGTLYSDEGTPDCLAFGYVYSS